MNKITYANKVDTRTTTDPEINKVTASTLNEIKTMWFNKETIEFFKNQCDCKSFFEKEYVIKK